MPYYTFTLPVPEDIKIDFELDNGFPLKEDKFDISIFYEEDADSYQLISLNNKFIIYNNKIMLTDQKVTKNSLLDYDEYFLQSKSD